MRQERVADEGSHLERSRRFARRGRGEEEELRARRVRARHVRVVHRPALAGSQVRERRVGRDHGIGAQAGADDAGVPDVTAQVSACFWGREQHGDAPGQSQPGAGDQSAAGRPQAVRDLVQRCEIPDGGEREQDEEWDSAVVRSNQTKGEERQSDDGAARPYSIAGADPFRIVILRGRHRELPSPIATTRAARRCEALARAPCAARRQAGAGPRARRRRTRVR